MNKTKKSYPEYSVYNSMKTRCYNPNRKYWHLYGGRGIKVCQRWLDDFYFFYDDMGARPSKMHHLDRIDPNGNYEPNNCRWVLPIENARNKRPEFHAPRFCINCGTDSNYRSWNGLCHACNEYKRRNNINRPLCHIQRKKEGIQKRTQKRIKRIAQYDLDGTHIADFTSVTDAIKIYGSAIMHNLSKKIKTAYGYVWKYV